MAAQDEYRFVSIPEELAWARGDCHGRVPDAPYADESWHFEMLEQVCCMLKQATKRTKQEWWSVAAMEAELDVNGIGFLQTELKTLKDRASRKAFQRTLHLFQEARTKLKTLVDECVALGAFEKRQCV